MSLAAISPADPRFPLGRFWRPDPITPEDHIHATLTLAEAPEQLREAVRGLDDEQLNTPYREGGWALRQVVHHLADSHSIAFTRFRLALTEEWPRIHGYNESAFAALPDTAAPVEWSLEMVESVHARWVMLLQHMGKDHMGGHGQWARGYLHPELGRVTLEHALLLYAWHSRHHVAHITHLRSQAGW